MSEITLLKVEKFISKVLHKFKINNYFSKKLNDMIHNKIERRLTKYFKYSQLHLKPNDNKKKSSNNNIWVFWYQGYNNMPLLVKKCVESIKKNSNGHKVIFLDKNNMSKYVKLPKYILDKLHQKKIIMANFSDILRFYLLYTYGGLWVDSTIFCVSPIKSLAFKGVYTSRGKISDKSHFFVSDGKWTGFLIGGSKGCNLFHFIYKFLCYYWKTNDKSIDYFLVDYALDYAYKKNIGNFKDYVDNDIHNNNNLHALENVINNKFNLNYYNKITSNTNMFKLTYKRPVKLSQKDTFFNKIVNKA